MGQEGGGGRREEGKTMFCECGCCGTKGGRNYKVKNEAGGFKVSGDIRRDDEMLCDCNIPHASGCW